MRQAALDRRAFILRSAGIVAVGIPAPYVTGISWAQDKAPGERLITAAIGVGGRGSDIGHQSSRLAKIVACADVHRGNAERFARRHGDSCEIVEDYHDWTHCSSVNACHMANIAMLLERKVRYDPEKRQFIDDKEANALMRREQRAPYVVKV